MTIKSYKLFYTPMCHKCPYIKEFLDSNVAHLKKEWIDASKKEGLEEAKKYNVSSVPTIIFFDEKNNITANCHNMEEIKRVVENKSLMDIK